MNNNPPDIVVKNFEKLKKAQEKKETEAKDANELSKNSAKEWRNSTWKYKCIKHEFKNDFGEPIPKENGDIFYILTQNELDELNRERAKTKAPYVYQKYKCYVETQKNILKSVYGNNYPLLNEHLKKDARIQSEKNIKKLVKKTKKLKKKNNPIQANMIAGETLIKALESNEVLYKTKRIV